MAIDGRNDRGEILVIRSKEEEMFDGLKGRTPHLIDFDEYRKFGLCIPVLEREGQVFVLFEVRAKSLKRQPGEVCLPGGSVETGESAQEAAIREICEELLLKREQVEMIAPMDINLSPSGQWIAPYLVQLKDYKETFSKEEVEEVFEVPLEFFWENEPKAYRNKVYTEPEEDFPFSSIPGGKEYPWHKGWNTVYFYPEFEGHVIWGLTAKIMRSSARILKLEAHEGYSNMA